ncbi:MAG TPA: hypothetical protein VH208_00925 [Myxococcaceae bacterium]|nr:hypothetical protein [Myxococcaceae bacterium]
MVQTRLLPQIWPAQAGLKQATGGDGQPPFIPESVSPPSAAASGIDGGVPGPPQSHPMR